MLQNEAVVVSSAFSVLVSTAGPIHSVRQVSHPKVCGNEWLLVLGVKRMAPISEIWRLEKHDHSRDSNCLPLQAWLYFEAGFLYANLHVLPMNESMWYDMMCTYTQVVSRDMWPLNLPMTCKKTKKTSTSGRNTHTTNTNTYIFNTNMKFVSFESATTHLIRHPAQWSGAFAALCSSDA